MKIDKTSVTSFQVLGFIVSAQIGFTIFSVPVNLVFLTGHDGWITMLISGLLIMLSAIILVKLLNKFKDKSIFEINTLLYGKFLGGIINFIITLYTFTIAFILLRAYAFIIEITVLRLTSVVILTLCIFLPYVYLSLYGLKPICRFSNITYFILAIILIYLIVIIKNMNINYILPVGLSGMKRITYAVPLSVRSYLGLELLAIIYPYIKDKDKLMKNIVAAEAVTALFNTLITLAVILIFGENLVSKLLLPFYNLSEIYASPLIERVDLFFISLWLPVFGNTMCNYFYCAHLSVGRLFNRINEKIRLLILAAAAFFLSLIPKDIITLKSYLDFLSYIGIAILLLYVFNYMFSFIRHSNQ